MQTIAEILSKELNETLPHVQNVIELLDGGNTVPFIARYRKEMHGDGYKRQVRISAAWGVWRRVWSDDR